MGCCQRKPVPIKEPNLITYNKMLISISNKHPEFDLRLVGILYSKEGSILLKVLIWYNDRLKIEKTKNFTILSKHK